MIFILCQFNDFCDFVLGFFDLVPGLDFQVILGVRIDGQPLG